MMIFRANWKTLFIWVVQLQHFKYALSLAAIRCVVLLCSPLVQISDLLGYYCI
jgi:hypothetical protein